MVWGGRPVAQCWVYWGRGSYVVVFIYFLFFTGEIILNERRLPGLGASGLQLPSCGDNPAEICVGPLAQ